MLFLEYPKCSTCKKAKKFVFYNLILKSKGPDTINEDGTTKVNDGLGCGCTVTSADMRVRMTGYSK